MKKTLRTGKVLVDWSQNSAAKTTIVPYSLRGRLTPTVAAPRTWQEIGSPRSQHLDYKAVLRRVKAGKDPFARSRGGTRRALQPRRTTRRTDHGDTPGWAETSPSKPATAAHRRPTGAVPVDAGPGRDA